MSQKLPASSSHVLYLVDISSMIFRAYYAIRPLHTLKGEPTNAVYGVLTMLSKLREEVDPKHLVVVHDSKEPSFREEIYEDYKANRGAPPDDLIPQFERIDQMIAALEIPRIQYPGYEADDLIATLCEVWIKKDPKNEVVIVSIDKDLTQLVSDRVRMWDTMKNIVYDREGVKNKFQVYPEQMKDYLTMIGDSSDNIPGVPGIGPKTASALLEEYGDLESILKAAQEEKIKGKKRESLLESKKMIPMIQELVTVKKDLDLKSVWKDNFVFSWKVGEAFLGLLEELHFTKLLETWKDYKSKNNKTVPDVPLEKSTSSVSWVTVDTEKKLLDLFKELAKQKVFAFDTETTSLNTLDAKLVGVSICFSEDRSYYIPFLHQESAPQCDLKKFIECFESLLRDGKTKLYGQNLKYDLSILKNAGLCVNLAQMDSMIADYLLDPSSKHDLDSLAKKYFDYSMVSFEEVCGKGKDQITFDQVSIEVATKYSAEDAWMSYKLCKKLEEDLKKENLLEVAQTLEIPLIYVLRDMELEGIRLDLPFLKKMSKELEGEIQVLEKKMNQFVPEGTNFNSPKQLQKILFEDLKLPTQTKTKTGFSTDASVLEILSKMHEFPKVLLEYRELQKLKSTYVDPLPTLARRDTNRVHTSYQQTVAATGRLSSTNPNLQNIPIRTEKGRLLRKAFIAKEGSVLLAADYSQIELRVLAHMSEDEDLVSSFQKGEDVHLRTASELFHKSVDSVSDDERRIAKAINFGLMYGKTAFGLAKELDLPRKEAQNMIDRYFERYSKVKEFLDGLIVSAKDKGYTETLWGRKRMLPDLHAKNVMVRLNAERMAMNTPIQGTAADLMKLAMIRVHEKLKGHQAHVLLQVHDELVVEVSESELKKVSEIVRKEMESVAKFSVPLQVNLEVGKNWLEMETV